ncbi:MAG: DUF1573 domain-containing protein [Paludibacter sp.]|nr:DUF1573 domain-containing protein [Paludibacter sp.]
MKVIKLFSITIILFSNIYFTKGQSAVHFTKHSFDFGKIALEDGIAYTEFNFKSVGKEYLMIKDIVVDGQDVHLTWEKRIYQHGKEGIISVGFEPTKEGVFKRHIKVETNGINENKIVLTITGEVVRTGKLVADNANHVAVSAHKAHNPTTFKMPAASKVSNLDTETQNGNILIAQRDAQGNTIYPIKQYGFALTSRVIDFKRVHKGDKQTVTIKIKNETGSTRDIYFAPLFEYINFTATPKTLEIGEEGEISITLDSEKCPIWGPYQAEFSLITEESSTSKNSPIISFKVDIYEDFNTLTAKQKQQAPHARFEATSIDLGKIDKNYKNVIKFTFYNDGESPLSIRKVTPADSFNILHCDGKVGAGENGVLELQINCVFLKDGQYSNKIILQTNDPNNPRTELIVNWTI